MITASFRVVWCALALTTAATGANAAELGRLFFTPEQRIQLEAGHPPEVNTPDNPQSLTVNGIVQKQGGKRTVWINGVPQMTGKSDERAPESAPVTVPGQSHPIKMKVGQKLQLSPSTPQRMEKQTTSESDD